MVSMHSSVTYQTDPIVGGSSPIPHPRLSLSYLFFTQNFSFCINCKQACTKQVSGDKFHFAIHANTTTVGRKISGYFVRSAIACLLRSIYDYLS